MVNIADMQAPDKGAGEHILSGDAHAAVEFLREFDATGWHNLVAIHPESGTIEGRTFEPNQFGEMREWVEARNGISNLYFTVNEVAVGTAHKKPTKQDVARIRAVFADLDPKEKDRSGFDEERGRVARQVAELTAATAVAPASFAIDSGNGFQLLWKLGEPLDAPASGARAEEAGAAVADSLGGDAIWNIDRVLRLPGTVNLPNARKKAKGRVHALATLVHSEGPTHTLDGLQSWAGAAHRRQEKSSERPEDVAIDMDAVQSVTCFDDLPEDLRRRFSEITEGNESIAGLWKGDRFARPGNDDSRSGFMFALAVALRPRGFSATDYGMLVRVWEVEGLEPFDATRRPISRAWANCQAHPADEDFEPVEVADRRTAIAAFPVRNVLADGVSRYQNYLVKGLINFGMVGLCAGSKNAGKSPLLLDIAAHVAKGEPWHGHRVRPAYVLYVATEGWTGIGNRLAAVRQEYFGGAETAALDYLATSINLRTSARDARSLIQTLNERAAHFGLPPGLLIIDTLSHTLAGGDDASQEHTKPVVAHAKMIAAETGAAVIFAHHPTKNGSSGVRGSSTLEDDTDLTIRVEKEAKSTKRWVTTPRVKDYAEIDPVAFDVRTIHLGEDQDGDDITSVVVSWRADAGDEFEVKLTDAQRDALKVLADLLESATSVSSSDWRRAFQLVRKSSGHSAAAKSTFTDAVRTLTEIGLVKKNQRNQYVMAEGPEVRNRSETAQTDHGELGPDGSPRLKGGGNRTGHPRKKIGRRRGDTSARPLGRNETRRSAVTSAVRGDPLA